GFDQAFRHAFDVVERHCLDEFVALVHIIDAEFLDLDPQQLLGDARRSLEPERIGSGETDLCNLELLGGGTLIGETLQLALNDVERLANGLVLGRHTAHEYGTMLIWVEVRVDRIGKPALLAPLLQEPRGESAAADDVIQHIGGDEIVVLARNTAMAE